MKKIKRRDKLKIYADLLSALRSEPLADCENIVLSHVQSRINVPFDRLKTYITDLVELNLIQDETSLKVTEKGRLYLREYNKILDFMKRIGLSYR
jgi:predicted transcriptional regulator